MYEIKLPYNLLSNNDKIVIFLLKIHNELTWRQLDGYSNTLTDGCSEISEDDLLQLVYQKIIYTKTKLHHDVAYYELTNFGRHISKILLDNLTLNIHKISASNRLVIDVTDAPINKIIEIKNSLNVDENNE